MTLMLFREAPYMRDANGLVVAHTEEGGVVLNGTIFYPQGGGQPGDAGMLHWEGGQMDVATTVKGAGDQIALVPSEPIALPPVGTELRQALDWDRRYAHMRIHTALHLLSVVLPFAVTGGAITAEKGRLDFAMPDPPEDKAAIETALQDLIDQDLPVTEDWITEADLDANPGLVKTMSVQPPRGQGDIRLVRIGEGITQVDLQPCGGTHVQATAEIGKVRIGKVEKKGALNRRVNVHLVD